MKINKYYLYDVLDGLKRIKNETVDIIIIDPPYNIGKDFGNNSYNLNIDDYIKWCVEWMNESIRILKPSGSMFIYGFSEILAHLSVNLPLNKRWLMALYKQNYAYI
jgi:site-specific DNA-methyltransferase (adenine-specific)